MVLKSSENGEKATKIGTKFVVSSVIRKNPQTFLCVRTDDITASDRPNESTRTIQVRPGVSTSSDLSFRAVLTMSNDLLMVTMYQLLRLKNCKRKVTCSAGLLSLSSIHGSVCTTSKYLLLFFYCEFVTCSFLESMEVHAIAMSSSWLDDAAHLHCNTAVRSRHPAILRACSKVKSIFKISKHARTSIKN